MKKIVLLVSITLFISTSVQARDRWGDGGDRWRDRGGEWVVPFLLGGAIGYEASRSSVYYDNSPRVLYNNPQRVFYDQDPQTIILQQSTPVPQYQRVIVVPNNNPVYEEREIYLDN
jgi:hypothetical protein